MRTHCLPPHSHQTKLSPLHRRENSEKKEGFDEQERKEIPEEPGVDSVDAVRVVIKLPDGQRLERRSLFGNFL